MFYDSRLKVNDCLCFMVSKFVVYTYRNAADIIAGGKLEGIVSDKLVVAQQQGCGTRELGE